jgi:hypothetical protein
MCNTEGCRACADKVQGHIVTLEITSGEVYRGKLIEGTPPHTLADDVPELTANS